MSPFHALPGGELEGVHQCHTIDDAAVLKDLRGGPVVVVGGGALGNEVAAAARLMGCEVTLLVPGTAPPQRRHGVRVMTHACVTAIRRCDDYLSVTLSDGWQVPTNTVLLAID